MDRKEVFITNVVKCRPPENRDPLPVEIKACQGYLDRQIALLRPLVIATLGRYSMAYFMPQETISRVHGRVRMVGQATVMPLYHPAAALRSPKVKEDLIVDFKKLPALLRDVEHSSARPAQQQQAATSQQLKLL
jgi:DNA polymerase